MRGVLVCAIGLLMVTELPAQAPKGAGTARRYGIEPDLSAYPQATPQETLASVLKAIDTKRLDYLLAQLADPRFVDARVQAYGGRFDELVREATSKLLNDPVAVKDLRRFLQDKDSEWDIGDTTASVHRKDSKERQVFFRRLDKRWFLENRQKAEK